MLSFEDFINFMTCDGRYGHFLMDRKFWDKLSANEQSLLHREPSDTGIDRIWLLSRWAKAPKFSKILLARKDDPFKERLMLAMLKGDLDEMKRILEEKKAYEKSKEPTGTV